MRQRQVRQADRGPFPARFGAAGHSRHLDGVQVNGFKRARAGSQFCGARMWLSWLVTPPGGQAENPPKNKYPHGGNGPLLKTLAYRRIYSFAHGGFFWKHVFQVFVDAGSDSGINARRKIHVAYFGIAICPRWASYNIRGVNPRFRVVLPTNYPTVYWRC